MNTMVLLDDYLVTKAPDPPTHDETTLNCQVVDRQCCSASSPHR